MVQQVKPTEYDTILNDCQIKIGGTCEKFVPNINVSKWDDECWLNIRHPDIVTSEKVTFRDGKIELGIGNNIHRYYEKDGKLEYEIILKSKPSFPFKIELNLDFSDDLTFYYQHTLRDQYNLYKKDLNRYHKISSFEEYQKISYRPENVEGSYAVLYKKQNNKYNAGNFCLIYCPYAVDKNGKRSKCSLLIENNKIYATPNEKFLDEAVYPVTIDPTFGFDEKGASTVAGGTGVIGVTARDDAPVTGTATKQFMYSADASSTIDVKIGLYDDSGGDPNSKVGSEVELTNVGPWSEGWKEFGPESLDVTQSVYYWQAFSSNEAIDTIWYTEVANAFRYDMHTYGDAWPATFVEAGALPYKMSAYSEIPEGGVTLVMSDLAHAHALDAPVLTQKHTISVGALDHSHTLDNVALTQKHSIVVGDLDHAHNLDAPILTQKHIIAIAGLDHAQSLDNVILTQAHLLALDAFAHGHTLDGIALTQKHTLADIGDLTHAHTIDNVVLSSAITLILDSLTHGHTLDTPTLIQAHLLSVADLAHAITLDNITLIQAHVLTVDDLGHEQALDGISLTQKHTLIVSDLSHAHAIDNIVLAMAGTLIVQNLTHGHALDTPTLVQAHELAINGLTHSHSLDGVVLSTGTTLVVGGLTHAHSLDGIAIVQAHVLAVNSLGHAHEIGTVTLSGIVLTEIQELISKGYLSQELVSVGSLSEELISKGYLSQELLSIMGDTE